MRRTILAVAVLFVAVSAFAQSGTLATPITPPSQTNVVVGNVTEHRADPNVTGDIATTTVELWVLTGAGTVADRWQVQMQGTEVASFEAARRDPAANEVASTSNNGARIENFRVLTFLKANCAAFKTPCLAAVPQITLVP